MNMFCNQCEQTAGGIGCTTMGVCGKNPAVAKLQDDLIIEVIRLAIAGEKYGQTKEASRLLIEGLFVTITNVNFDEADITKWLEKVRSGIKILGEVEAISSEELFRGDKDIVSLRQTLLYGLKGTAAYAHHAYIQGYEDEEIYVEFNRLVASLLREHTIEIWLENLMACGTLNLKTMALLDKANTTSFGSPMPNEVTTHIEKGPFIIVTGHDLYDLKMLLEQTEGKGVNIYTHGEMLPAHGYPELRKYSHLKGNFGTAWNNQRKEFDNVPAPILYTTNCIMPPKESYREGIFTTSVVAYPNTHYIGADEKGHKDFTPLIKKALELGGYQKTKVLTGANGGEVMPTGFGHGAILSHAGEIVEAVKAGKISHFFLVGGCDGAKPGRSYYTELVEKAPNDSVILTLACGKFRFNDLNLGTVAGLPRLLDMGQCNDAYGAVQVAVALAKAFDCEVNDLPLTLVLSWYEQKAVCVLLTLLSLGIKNIYIGPSLPAFFSDTVLNTLVELFDLHPITTAEEDLKTILKK